MARIELDLPEDLRAGMVAHPEIEWDVVAVQATLMVSMPRS